MKTESDLILITVRSILAILIVLVLVAGKSLLIPFAWSMLIALASVNFIDRVEQKTPLSRTLVIFIFLLLILVVIILVGYFFYIELHRIFNDLPALSQEISANLHNLSLSQRKTGIHIPDHIDNNFISDWVNHHNNLVMNFISELGMDIWNIILIVLFALITKDNVWIPVSMFAALFVMNFLQDNVIRPLIIGDKMKINAFAVFVAIIIGGMIWGVSGMILFIPVAGIIKIILEGHKMHEPYAIFLSSPEKKPGTIQSSGNNMVN